MSLRTTTTLLLLAGLAACDSSDAPPPEPAFVVSGEVEFVNIEGGCLVFHGDDGNDYHLFAEPSVGLEPVHEHGAWLEVELRRRPDLAGFCPGQIAEVLHILSASLPLFATPEQPWLILTDRDGAMHWAVVPGSAR